MNFFLVKLIIFLALPFLLFGIEEIDETYDLNELVTDSLQFDKIDLNFDKNQKDSRKYQASYVFNKDQNFSLENDNGYLDLIFDEKIEYAGISLRRNNQILGYQYSFLEGNWISAENNFNIGDFKIGNKVEINHPKIRDSLSVFLEKESILFYLEAFYNDSFFNKNEFGFIVSDFLISPGFSYTESHFYPNFLLEYRKDKYLFSLFSEVDRVGIKEFSSYNEFLFKKKKNTLVYRENGISGELYLGNFHIKEKVFIFKKEKDDFSKTGIATFLNLQYLNCEFKLRKNYKKLIFYKPNLMLSFQYEWRNKLSFLMEFIEEEKKIENSYSYPKVGILIKNFMFKNMNIEIEKIFEDFEEKNRPNWMLKLEIKK